MGQRFEVLDSFRGLCASFVVVHHINILGAFSNLSFFKNSSIFVEFFFILSGFVLTHTYLNRDISLKNYFITRTYRLYPLHLFMLCCFLILELSKLLASNYISLNYPPFLGASAPSEIIPNALLVQAWTVFTENTSFNYPSWSISIEYYVYFIFFFTLALSGFKKYLAWALLSLMALWAMKYDLLITNNALRGLYSFFGGSLLYILFTKLKAADSLTFKKYKFLFSIFEILSIVCLVLFVSFVDNYFLNTALFFVMILIFSFEIGSISKLLKLFFFKRLGELSYSIYMVHALLILVFTTIFIILEKITDIKITESIESVRYFNLGNDYYSNLFLLLILLSVYFVSTLTYKYIEIPGIKLGKKKVKP